jgi:hypothetical protein
MKQNNTDVNLFPPFILFLNPPSSLRDFRLLLFLQKGLTQTPMRIFLFSFFFLSILRDTLVYFNENQLLCASIFRLLNTLRL